MTRATTRASFARLFFYPFGVFAAQLVSACSVLIPTDRLTIPTPPAIAQFISPSAPAVPSSIPTPTPAATRTLVPSPMPTPRCSSSVPINLATARSGRIDTKFHSNLLGKDMPILIYLPPGYYDSQRCYPVLYMLHGFGGPYTEWEKWGLLANIDPMIRSGEIQPMIAVLPEGERSYWFNHAQSSPDCPNGDGQAWGDYVWKEVVGYVDANYRTWARRTSRAVGGLSSGGQGALMLGLTQPQVFGIVGAHSPSFRGSDGSLPFFCSSTYFNQYDPIWLAKNQNTAHQLTIWMDDGDDDDVWGTEIRKYNDLLNSLGIAHEWHVWPGKHEGTYWAPHVPDYLRWYSSKLAGQ